MNKDKAIWISEYVGTYRQNINNSKKVSFFEKFQKTFFEGDIAFINNQFNTNFDFEDIKIF